MSVWKKQLKNRSRLAKKRLIEIRNPLRQDLWPDLALPSMASRQLLLRCSTSCIHAVVDPGNPCRDDDDMTYKYPNAVLMIFCKAPIPGQVKTRLIPELTAEQAAELHIELSTKTLQRATQSHLCPVQLWCSPTTDHDFFNKSKAAYPLTLKQQQGADLGERMHRAFCSALTAYSHALLMGCDCPSLTEQDLEAALTALTQENEVVLAPAEDGGYVLIGLNRPQPELFDNMPWGTAQVLNETRNRIERYKLHHHELSKQWDLDTPKDLERYRALTPITKD